ncbi:MAG TPA: hypothetical protein VFQ76_17095 [Longimicrobiaceae bacterium]|nr:hypothetical protein [Longimicrobiaceae bacterium]
MGQNEDLPPGRPWTAPNGNEYRVAVVEVTERPGTPEGVPRRWDVLFYRDGAVELAETLPGHSLGADLSHGTELTDEQLLKIYEAARSA